MKIVLTVIVLAIFCEGRGDSLQKDSVVSDSSTAITPPKRILRFTTRLHSTGFFNFSGRICSPTPAADINFLWEKKGYGVSVFSVRDLYDKHSDNNFTFGIAYKRFTCSRRFTITPSFGVVMDGFGDTFGDRIFIISAFKASPKLTIDETTLVANALNPMEEKEWVNRIRIMYAQTSQLQFILSNWHNNAVFDEQGYFSTSLQALYSRIKIADRVHAQTSVSFFVMAKNSEEVPKQEKSGLMFAFAISIE
ncbi:MAG TPA: hypothetical protein VGD65_18560 [Chryseosolibacter sp.]